MFETLHKTDVPTELDHVEYYQPNLEVENSRTGHYYCVREKHGWFVDAEKRAVHHTSTLSPEEGFATFEEAQRRYDQQVQKRASEGFVHSFSVDPMSDPPVRYRRIR
jgi:hypothetical protein